MNASTSLRALSIIACAALTALTLPAPGAGAASRSVAVAMSRSVHPIVVIHDGVVRGVAVASGYTFRGLPYAAAPTRDLRWRPPQPSLPWPGVRDATQYAASCPQKTSLSEPPGAQSEDCLYLNVSTPTLRSNGDRPVLVWIHGGGLTEDGARNYDGSKLAADGVVVVTINYRLGALGFLAHPALASRPGGPAGNYGLMDQQAALRWVQRNIARFGGNPDNVTIAGESAGGLSVLAQLVSHGARGLFQRAIVQSGAFALHQGSLADAEAAGQNFASTVGCSVDTADCLRHASVTDLVNDFGVEIPGYVDGSVLRESIDTALANGRFARVPILNGITHDEERLFVDAVGIAVSQGTDVLIPGLPITDANYQDNIAAVLGVSQARAAAVASEYPPSAYANDDVAFSTLVSDAEFACPALQVDRWTAPRVPTFAYQFNDDNAPFVLAPPGFFPAVATHGSELPYLFDEPNAPFPATLDADQQALAAHMRKAWTNFAAKGRPSTAAASWPSFNRSSDVLSLVLPQPQVESSFAATHHCAFWAAG